jgi:hypothetical protein
VRGGFAAVFASLVAGIPTLGSTNPAATGPRLLKAGRATVNQSLTVKRGVPLTSKSIVLLTLCNVPQAPTSTP